MWIEFKQPQWLETGNNLIYYYMASATLIIIIIHF